MIIRGATHGSRLAVIFAFLFVVTACGSGGSGDNFYDGDQNQDGLRLSILDPAGNGTDTVTASSPGTLKVSVRGGGSGIVVTATTDIGFIFPKSGTALTSGNGVATFQIEAGPERGAGTITATATVDDEAVTGSTGFRVGETGLRLGYFDTDGSFVENRVQVQPESTLSAGGNAQLSVVILDNNGNRVTTVEDIRFNSGCIGGGQAIINPENPAKSVNGQASTLYTAAGCTGLDEITASLAGASAQAFADITIASATANAINFVSAEPTLIVLRGTGGQNRDEASNVVFKVVDGSGLPLQGVTVDFSLSTYAGGLSLSTDSTLSGGDGGVVVTVRSGDVATVVRVIATVDDGDGEPVSTVSDLLTVTTGLPDQDSMSLSVGDCEGQGTFVVDGGFNTFGLCRTLTVAMADKFNNPVVDGTAAVFTTEYGSIVGSCATVGGSCGVEWRSQEPRLPLLTGDDFVNTIFDQNYDCPSHNGSEGPCPDDLGYIRGGRSTILVHAIGEESFIDRNGNGVMDQDEKDLFDNVPEAFLDTNEDGVYTPDLASCSASPTGSLQCIAGQEDTFVDFNANGAYDRNDNPAVYNGLLCPLEGDGVWCSRELVHVRALSVVTMGNGPNWDIILVRSGRVVSTSDSNNTNQVAYISDNFNNPPPGGATVALSTTGDCEVVGESSFNVPNIDGIGNGAFGVPVTTRIGDGGIIGDLDPGSVIVALTSISGNYSEAFACTGLGDPLDCDFSPKPAGCPD
jgi:hypothetical protein